MSKIRVILLALLALALTVPLRPVPSVADEPDKAGLDLLLNTIRTNRRAFVAINLQLTDDEAGEFWPVYDRYQADISALADRLVALIRDYTEHFGTLSNDKAMEIVGDYLEIEAERVKVRSSYVDRFAAALPGRKVARLYQIENKMDAVIRYDLASTIPVIDEKAEDPPK